MSFFYPATLFVSAALLFWVQPMVAKMILPLLGGTPAVWNTCMLFYQTLLLAGYAYAHFLSSRLAPRRQAVAQGVLLAAAFFVLPIGIAKAGAPPADGNPIPWLLSTLTLALGLPFFVVSSTSPLLQRWFSLARRDRDPYFLYSASNLGSLLALVAYPLFLEMNFPLAVQSRAWSAGFAVLAALTAMCAVGLWRTAPAPRPAAASAGAAIPAARRLQWVALAFVPSSLFLGVTTYITTDIAPMPLLWVVPLALYLLSFVWVFARRPPFPSENFLRALPMTLLPAALLLMTEASRPAWLVMLVHLANLFVVAMVCHGELARRRPPAENLTEFYLWMSVGGAAGGLFNALLGPVLFNEVAEYPLTLVLAAALWPRPESERPKWTDVLWPAALGLGTWAALQIAGGLLPARLSLKPLLALPVIVCFLFSTRPLRFGLGLGSLLLVALRLPDETGRKLFVDRSFFGVNRVSLDPEGRFHWFTQGRTIHGGQSLDPARRREPITYFHRAGPIGQLFTALREKAPSLRVGITGLGAGVFAGYAVPGDAWDFYEIDPLVERIARDERYFTFLSESPAPVRVILGDARLSLVHAPEAGYDLLVFDAFGSDAIPVHLVTREAVALYLKKLAPGGVLVFNLSNRYLRLLPVLGNLAADAGLAALFQEDLDVTPELVRDGKLPSRWVVMARDPKDFGALARDPRWQILPPAPDRPVWTDDFSNILSVFRWE